jgi:hypothetical protein
VQQQRRGSGASSDHQVRAGNRVGEAGARLGSEPLDAEQEHHAQADRQDHQGGGETAIE